MENPDQTQDTRSMGQVNEVESNQIQEAHIKRPVATIQYPPTQPTIKETEAITRKIHRPTHLEEDSEDHSDDDEFHDSITQMEPDDDKLAGTEPMIETKTRLKNLCAG